MHILLAKYNKNNIFDTKIQYIVNIHTIQYNWLLTIFRILFKVTNRRICKDKLRSNFIIRNVQNKSFSIYRVDRTY